MKTLVLGCAILALVACSKNDSDKQAAGTDTEQTPADITAVQAEPVPKSLDDVLAMQDEDSKLRFSFRHPKQTLEFFGIEPGMTVIEALPGGGWYSKIIAPFLGADGALIGVDYDMAMWPNFSFVNDEFLERRKTWPQSWPQDARAWSGDNGAQVSAHTFATLPEALSDSVDMVLFIRALHNLARFESKGQYLTKALQESARVLKPGGLVGVVQHRAQESKSEEWADGSRGYLKQSVLVKRFTDAGFILLKESEINANPKDKPGDDDIVWRLPPSYSTIKKGSEDEQKMRAAMDEIGESDRMTLLFQKPQST